MVINLIACIDRNGGIGYQNRLLFHIKKDMERFRLLTTGHTIVMGRKTYDSLPNGALPNRRNIVISKQDIHLAGCEVYHSMEEALLVCQEEEVFVIGGASIYEQTLKLAQRLYLTIVDQTTVNVDATFPPFDKKEWKISSEEVHTEEGKNGKDFFRYTFAILEKQVICQEMTLPRW